MVSCYVRLGPEDREGRRYLAEVRAAAGAAARALVGESLGRAARQAALRDLRRAVEHVENPANLPRSRGLALFVSSPLRLFQAIPVPRVARTRVVVGRRALIDEVAAAELALGRLLVVVLDRAHARFFTAGATDVEEVACLRSPALRGGKFHGDAEDAPGWGEHRYHDRVREERHRHYRAVGRELAALARRTRARGFVIAGPGTRAVTFARSLPPRLAARVIGNVRLNPTELTPAAVHTVALAARLA